MLNDDNFPTAINSWDGRMEAELTGAAPLRIKNG
jgi:hypothetical protein